MKSSSNLFKRAYLFLYPRNWYLRSRLDNGAYVLGLNKAGFGGRGVFIERDSIEPELVHLEMLLAGRNSFLDIGANTGVYTLKAAKAFNGSGVVIACEPFTGVYQSLIKSVEYNNFKNVRLRNICVGEEKGLQEFFMNFGKPNSFSLFQFDNTAKSLIVPVISVDELVAWERLTAIDFIKIDAEGAETAIIRGACETIKKFRPIIQLETFDNSVMPLLDGYKFLKIEPSPNVLCIPEGDGVIVKLLDIGYKYFSISVMQ